MKYEVKSLVVSVVSVTTLFLLCNLVNLIPSTLALIMTSLTSFAMVDLDKVTD